MFKNFCVLALTCAMVVAHSGDVVAAPANASHFGSAADELCIKAAHLIDPESTEKEGYALANQYPTNPVCEFALGVFSENHQLNVSAHKYYRASAAQGYFSAMEALGVVYGEGIGIDIDYAVSLNWFKQALSACVSQGCSQKYIDHIKGNIEAAESHLDGSE